MPISISVGEQVQVMTLLSIRAWIEGAALHLPADPDTLRRLGRFLVERDRTYREDAQQQFIQDFQKSIRKELWPLDNDWGLQKRDSKRIRNFSCLVDDERVDWSGSPRRDDRYLHPCDLQQLNTAGRDVMMEHLSMGELFDLYDVVVLGETHAENAATKYLYICDAMLASAATEDDIRTKRTPKFEILVLLDGLAVRGDHLPLTPPTVRRNFPKFNNHLFERYDFYGLEPEETEMFSRCENLNRGLLNPEDERTAAQWLYFQVRENEEFGDTLKQDSAERYNAIMNDANHFAAMKELTPGMKFRVASAASAIEFANRSTIRMDANVAWGRTITEVLSRPSDREVRALVICGANHTLCRTEYSIPVQAAPRVGVSVQTLLLEDTSSASVDLRYRQVDESKNYVFTVPRQLLELSKYFVLPPMA